MFGIVAVFITTFFLALFLFKAGSFFFSKTKHENLQFFDSKKSLIAESFFAFFILFLTISLVGFNHDFGGFFEWYTVILLCSVLGFFLAYRKNLVLLLFLAVSGLIAWWVGLMLDFSDIYNISPVSASSGIMILGIGLYSFGRLLDSEKNQKRFALIYKFFGILTTTSVLFAFSSKQALKMLNNTVVEYSAYHHWQIFFFVLFFLFALAMIFWTKKNQTIAIWEFTGSLFLISLFALISYFPFPQLFSGLYLADLSTSGLVWAVVLNLTLFFYLFGFIMLGYQRKEETLINFGSFFLFVFILVKYFDWFFSFMDKSVFFIGAGFLMFVVGWFMERSRKFLINEIETK